MSQGFKKSVPKSYADHFDGDPMSWMKWYSVLQATIDKALMTPSEMMIHLQSLLTGETKALVGCYGCNGDLYASALHRLEEHFGSPKRIVNAFLEKLIQISQFIPSSELHTLLFFSFDNGGYLSAFRIHS